MTSDSSYSTVIPKKCLGCPEFEWENDEIGWCTLEAPVICPYPDNYDFSQPKKKTEEGA